MHKIKLLAGLILSAAILAIAPTFSAVTHADLKSDSVQAPVKAPDPGLSGIASRTIQPAAAEIVATTHASIAYHDERLQQTDGDQVQTQPVCEHLSPVRPEPDKAASSPPIEPHRRLVRVAKLPGFSVQMVT